jgi:hypothetical protein
VAWAGADQASIPVCAADRSTLSQHLYEKTIYAVPPSTGSIVMKAAVEAREVLPDLLGVGMLLSQHLLVDRQRSL